MRFLNRVFSSIFEGLAKKNMITGLQLQQIVPGLPFNRAAELAYVINTVCPKYGINTKNILAAFIAQVAHESGGFSSKTESLNYSVQGLINTFNFYKRNPALAEKHGRTANKPADQQAIANTVYADKNRSTGFKLGNTQDGDGWRFRGSGWLQLTGRAIFEKYARYVKQDLTNAVDNIRTTDLWACESAAWVFAVEKSLLDEADKGNFEKITRAINGSTNGAADRLKYYNMALKVL